MHLRSGPVPSNASRWLWPIRLLFSVEALCFALLLPRIPDIKLALDLGEAELGVALLRIPGGTLIGLLVAPATARELGTKRAAWLSVTALAWACVLPGLARSQVALLAAFFVCGIGVSHTEIALSSLAGRIEATSGTRIMSQCHGFWSVGSIVAVMTGGGLAQVDVSVVHQAVLAAVLLTTCVFALARWLPAPAAAASHIRSRFALPSRALLPLCLLPVGIMVIEGIFMDWSAVYLRLIVGADPFGASLGFATLAAAMAVIRLSGDRIVDRFGETQVVFVSNLAASAGMLVFALAPTLSGALVGAALCGVGVAVVYPATLSAAARAAGSPEHNIAAVSFTSFLILLGSPAAFGFLVESIGFRGSIALCAVLVLPSLVLVRALQARPA